MKDTDENSREDPVLDLPLDTSAIEKPWTIGQVAKYFGIDDRTIKRRVEALDFPAPFTIGRVDFWLPSVIREFQLKAHRRAQRRARLLAELKREQAEDGGQSRTVEDSRGQSRTSAPDADNPPSQRKNHK